METELSHQACRGVNLVKAGVIMNKYFREVLHPPVLVGAPRLFSNPQAESRPDRQWPEATDTQQQM